MLLKSRFVEMFGDINLPNTKWKMTPLGKNATLFNGRAYKQEELLDSGKYKLLRVGNFFSTKDWYYSDLELEADKYCDTGDLLFAWSASFGAKIWDQGKVIYHYHIWKVIPNENYNKEFLCFLLNEKTESLKKQTHGSTMMHLTKIGMEQTLFIVPPISLQNQFVDFIHQIDKLKVILNQIDEKIELLKKSRFVELFGDPVQNDKCWPIDFCKNLTSKIGSGATPKGGQQSYCSEGISLIRSMNVFNNYFDYTDLAHINEDQAHALDNVIIEEKDVLLNITGASVARCCLAPNDLLPARVNQHVSIIRCKERLLPEFVCSLFTSDKYQKLLLNTARAGGATREALTKQQIENLQIIIPPLEEQRKYIEEVKQLDKLKVAIHKELELIG